MAGNVVIRPVGEDERAAWEPLWNGYLAFYKQRGRPAPATRRGSAFTIRPSRCSCGAPTSTAG